MASLETGLKHNPEAAGEWLEHQRSLVNSPITGYAKYKKTAARMLLFLNDRYPEQMAKLATTHLPYGNNLKPEEWQKTIANAYKHLGWKHAGDQSGQSEQDATPSEPSSLASLGVSPPREKSGAGGPGSDQGVLVPAAAPAGNELPASVSGQPVTPAAPAAAPALDKLSPAGYTEKGASTPAQPETESAKPMTTPTAGLTSPGQKVRIAGGDFTYVGQNPDGTHKVPTRKMRSSIRSLEKRLRLCKRHHRQRHQPRCLPRNSLCDKSYKNCKPCAEQVREVEDKVAGFLRQQGKHVPLGISPRSLVGHVQEGTGQRRKSFGGKLRRGQKRTEAGEAQDRKHYERVHDSLARQQPTPTAVPPAAPPTATPPTATPPTAADPLDLTPASVRGTWESLRPDSGNRHEVKPQPCRQHCGRAASCTKLINAPMSLPRRLTPRCNAASPSLTRRTRSTSPRTRHASGCTIRW